MRETKDMGVAFGPRCDPSGSAVPASCKHRIANAALEWLWARGAISERMYGAACSIRTVPDWRDIVGPGLVEITERVVLRGQTLQQAERELHWPARSGKLVLKIALERLADAQAIEARQRQDAETGLARKGESAVAESHAPCNPTTTEQGNDL